MEICDDPFIIIMSIIIAFMLMCGVWKVSNEYNRRENIQNSIHKLAHQVDSLSFELKTLKENVTE